VPFNIALECDIKKVQENQVGLKLNGTHHLLAYVEDVNLLGDYIETINRNRETLTNASKEVGLEVNIQIAKYMFSHHKNASQNPDMKGATRTFENVTQFRYLRTTITNQNLIQEDIRRRLNSGNVCYHSVKNVMSFLLLSKAFKNCNKQDYNLARISV
jgi:hypothetical protein